MPTSPLASPGPRLPQSAHTALAEAPAQTTGGPPIWASQTLLGGGRTVHIEHNGAIYELRATRLGKLILTK